jgi:hypothetical protein
MDNLKQSFTPAQIRTLGFSGGVIGRHARLVNSSSSSEDVAAKNRGDCIYPHINMAHRPNKPEQMPTVDQRPCKHTRRRTMDHLDMHNEAGVSRLQVAKKRKGRPRRQSLPAGITHDVALKNTQLNQETRDLVLRTTGLIRQQSESTVMQRERQQHQKGTPTTSSCLPYKRNQDSNDNLLHKASGCRVTISTSKRATDYMKTLFTHPQDILACGNERNIGHSTLPKQPAPVAHYSVAADVLKQCQEQHNTFVKPYLEKKVLDLKEKFEKKFTNASTFDCSFPITSSPISKETTNQLQRPLQCDQRCTPDAILNPNEHSVECVKTKLTMPSEISKKARRQSSSLQRCKNVFRVKRDEQTPFKQRNSEGCEQSNRSQSPPRHQRTSSQDSVLTSNNRVDPVDEVETILPGVVQRATPTATFDDAGSGDVLDGKTDLFRGFIKHATYVTTTTTTTDNTCNVDPIPKKAKSKAPDPTKLFERGKLRDSKRNSKYNKHKRTLSVPSDKILDTKRAAIKKPARIDDKNLRLSKRKGRKVDVRQSLITTPREQVNNSSNSDDHKENPVVPTTIPGILKVPLDPEQISNVSSDTNSEHENKTITPQDENISTVVTTCYNIIPNMSSKYNKWDKQLKRTASTNVVATPSEGLCVAVRTEECLEAQTVVHNMDDKTTNYHITESTGSKTGVASVDQLDKGCYQILGNRKPAMNSRNVVLSPHKRGIDETSVEVTVAVSAKKTKIENIHSKGDAQLVAGCYQETVEPQNDPFTCVPHQLIDANDTNTELLNTVAGCIERLEKGMRLGCPTIESTASHDSLFLDSSQQIRHKVIFFPDASGGTDIRGSRRPMDSVDANLEHISQTKIELDKIHKIDVDHANMAENVIKINRQTLKERDMSKNPEGFPLQKLIIPADIHQVQHTILHDNYDRIDATNVSNLHTPSILDGLPASFAGVIYKSSEPAGCCGVNKEAPVYSRAQLEPRQQLFISSQCHPSEGVGDTRGENDIKETSSFNPNPTTTTYSCISPHEMVSRNQMASSGSVSQSLLVSQTGLAPAFGSSNVPSNAEIESKQTGHIINEKLNEYRNLILPDNSVNQPNPHTGLFLPFAAPHMSRESSGISGPANNRRKMTPMSMQSCEYHDFNRNEHLLNMNLGVDHSPVLLPQKATCPHPIEVPSVFGNQNLDTRKSSFTSHVRSQCNEYIPSTTTHCANSAQFFATESNTVRLQQREDSPSNIGKNVPGASNNVSTVCTRLDLTAPPTPALRMYTNNIINVHISNNK